MLEFGRALLAGPALPVSVVFVFNGGEETILQVTLTLTLSACVRRPQWWRGDHPAGATPLMQTPKGV